MRASESQNLMKVLGTEPNFAQKVGTEPSFAIGHGRESVVGPFYEREHYSLSKPTKPNFKQVISTYVYSLTLAGLTAYFIVDFRDLSQRFNTGLVIGGIVISGFIFLILPGFLRSRAIRKAGLKVVHRSRSRRQTR